MLNTLVKIKAEISEKKNEIFPFVAIANYLLLNQLYTLRKT